MSDEAIPEVELKRRQRLGHAMGQEVLARASTHVWDYEARVSPEYLRDDNDHWRITIEGTTAEGRHRSETFDVATAVAYHKLLGEVLAKFDAGEVKNPWEKSDGQ